MKKMTEFFRCLKSGEDQNFEKALAFSQIPVWRAAGDKRLLRVPKCGHVT
jgi:hypothetical protein